MTLRRAAVFVVAALLSGCLVEPAAADPGTVPAQAYQWRGVQVQFVRQELGLNAPVPLLAAQVHQESRWRPGAESPVGARGLAQFMPDTAGHVEELSGGPDKTDTLTTPRASLRAQAVYMRWLRDRAEARDPATEADHWAWVLSGYNGGLGWLDQERQSDAGDPRRWYCDTYHARARSRSAWEENRHYVTSIKRGQGVYRDAGWLGPVVQRGGRCGDG